MAQTYLNSTLLVILVLSMHWCAEGAPQMIRLCSKSLSDALYLTCMGRGYQDFITYSDGLDPKVTLGTGLVEECCHQPCTYKQLEQYCKPLPSEENSNSRIEESLRIVNLPYSSRRTVTKEGAEDEVQIKSKKRHHRHDPFHRGTTRIHGFPKVFDKQMERLGSSGQRRQDEGKSMRKAKKNDNEKSFFNGCQRWLKKPRRCTQTQLKKSMRKVPNFVIGTILPEPNDSLVLFPSKSHKDYWRATQGFSPDMNKLEVTMKKPGITRLTHNHPQITSPIENA